MAEIGWNRLPVEALLSACAHALAGLLQSGEPWHGPKT